MTLQEIIQQFKDIYTKTNLYANTTTFLNVSKYFFEIGDDLQENLAALKDYAATTFPGYRIWPIVGSMRDANTRAFIFMQTGKDEKEAVLKQLESAAAQAHELAGEYAKSPEKEYRALLKKCLIQASGLAALASTVEAQDSPEWKQKLREDAAATQRLIEEAIEVL